MIGAGLLPTIQELARTVAPGDAELLNRFVAGRDDRPAGCAGEREAAFAALVRRHGRMVFDVCRCVLGHDADAEDAFQATFLVLARNAASVRKASSLASWLHGVAHRVARKARAAAARRREVESRAANRQTADPNNRNWGEVQQVIHEELLALPERLRAVLVLCYLEGLTQDRAADALGLSKAAVKKRLERGRARLRDRLTRRGFGPVAVLAAFASPAAVSAVPHPLETTATRAAVQFATDPHAAAASIPASVLALAGGGLRSMFAAKVKIALCLLPVLALGVVFAGNPGVPGIPVRLTPLATAADDTKDAKETPAGKEAKWLAGEWRVRHVETDGEALFKDDDLKEARIVFKDNKAEVKGFEVIFVRDFSFKLDPTKNPKEIDVTFLEGPEKGTTFEGIYLVRKDEMRICLRLMTPELGRPKGYATVSGTTLYTFILEPVDKKNLPPVHAAPVPPPARGKEPVAAEPLKSLAGRLVVGDPKPVAGAEGSRVSTVFVEITNNSSEQANIRIDTGDVKLQLVDDAGKPVAESGLPRSGPMPESVTGVVPGGGYTGFPIPRGPVGIPKGVLTLAPGNQDWTLKPGKYTLKGTVTVIIPPVQGSRVNRDEVGLPWGSVKLELKPVTFTVAE
jgi:RNA polymerase sigma factor (sigma-70 family)